MYSLPPIPVEEGYQPPNVRWLFNRIYKPVFTTNCRYIDAWGGRGRGGSHFGTELFLFHLTQPKYFRGFFVRQTLNDIRDSLWRDFRDRVKQHCDDGELREVDFHFNDNEMRCVYLPTGNMIGSKGVKADGGRTAKMKSLAGASHVLIEEADEVGEEDFDQLDLSLRTVKADNVQIIRIFNPPGKTHWIWRDYVLTDSAQLGVDANGKLIKGYFEAKPKTSSGVLSIFSTWRDNAKNLQQSTKEKYESYKTKKPEYYWTIVRGLISEGMKGRVFSGWQSITNDFFNSIDARSIFGQDFGSGSPAGLVECKIVGTKIYIRQQNYVGATEKELGVLYCRLGLKDQVIIGDSAEPLTIGKLRRGWQRHELSAEEAESYGGLLKGWNIFGAIKGPGSIKTGIDRLKDYEVFVTEDSSDLWNEYREYRWALDKNKNPTDEPEDANNHLIDPIRYVVTGKGRYF